MDARQNQVYHGRFVTKNGTLNRDDADGIVGDEALLDYDSHLICDVVVGDGVQLVQTDTAQTVQVHPTAVDIARLGLADFLAGKAVSADNALPVYLRDNAWKTLAEQGKA